MADIGQEIEDSERLVERAAWALRELSPKHSLLKYHFLSPEEEVKGRDPEKEEQLRTELKNLFWTGREPWQGRSGAEVTCTVLCGYYFALKQAVYTEAALRGVEAPGLP